MVVHPSQGHFGDTLVNALLHHCGLPSVSAESSGTTADARTPVALNHSALLQSRHRTSSHSAAASGTESLDDFDGGDDEDGDIDLASADDSFESDSDSYESGIAVAARRNGASSQQEVVLRPGIVHRLDKGAAHAVLHNVLNNVLNKVRPTLC